MADLSIPPLNISGIAWAGYTRTANALSKTIER